MSRHLHGAAQFDALQTEAGDRLVVVDFHAVWCGPCKVIAPTFEALAQQHSGRALFAKVDGDQNRDLAARLGVNGFPTFVLLRSGRELDRIVGANAEGLMSSIARHITPPPPPEPTSPFANVPARCPVVIRDNDKPKAAAEFVAKVGVLAADELARVSLLADQLVAKSAEVGDKPGVTLKVAGAGQWCVWQAVCLTGRQPFVHFFQSAPEETHFAAVDLLRLLLGNAAGARAVALMSNTPLDVLPALLSFALQVRIEPATSKALLNRNALAWEAISNALAEPATRIIVLAPVLAYFESVTSADAFSGGLPRLQTAKLTALLNVCVHAYQLRDQRVVDVCAAACVHAVRVVNVRVLGAIGTLFWCAYVQSKKPNSTWDVTSAMILSSLDLSPFAAAEFAPVVAELRAAFELPLQ